jgi:tetratricopeptide (TPR) repeat protein
MSETAVHRSRNRQILVLWLLLALVTAALYWPVIHHDFVNFDDPDYATKHPHITTGLSWANIRWAFTSIHSTNWHPLTSITHMLDCQLYGVHPTGPHLTNLFLHIINSLLLLLLLHVLTGALWRSAFVAALFALHPMHVESVAWVSERKDVLSAFFFMLTLLAYARYVGTFSAEPESHTTIGPAPETAPQVSRLTFHNSRFPALKSLWYGAALLFFALGLMSKPMLVTLPFVLLLLDFWPLGRLTLPPSGSPSKPKTLFLEKAPFFVLSLASCLVTFLVQKASGTVMALEIMSPAARLANAVISYARYLGKFFWPSELTVFYPFREWHWLSWQVLGAVLLLTTLTLLALLRVQRKPWFLVGWLWFLGTLVPVIGIVQVGDQAMADRYSYLPYIGPFIILAWGTAELVGQNKPSSGPGTQTHAVFMRTTGIQTALAVLVLGACAFATSWQLPVWQNTETLFKHALQVTRNNHTAEANLGLYLVEQGRFDEAIECYQKAVHSKTNFPHAWNNLGLAYVRQKRYEEGVAAFETALRLYPSLAETECNLGNALMALGKRDDAIAHYTKAVVLKPDYALARANLGGMLLRQGSGAEAIEHLRVAAQLGPRNAFVHSDLARSLVEHGDLDEAVNEFKIALAVQPGFATAQLGLGETFVMLGRDDEASIQFQAVLNEQPEDATALYQMALLLARKGEIRQAVLLYRRLLNAAPDFPEALNNLAWILAANADPQLRDGKAAVELARRACELTNNQQPVMIGTLAAAYAEAGRFPEAVATAEKAKALAEQQKEETTATKNSELLEVYRAGKPYHEAQSSNRR